MNRSLLTHVVVGVVGALVMLAVCLWWFADVEEAVDESRHPRVFKEMVRATLAEAAANDRHVLLWFERDESDSVWPPSGPHRRFEREVVQSKAGKEFFARRVRLEHVRWGGRFMRCHLPEPLQWMGGVVGGPAVAEIEAAGDSYAGDKHAAKLDWVVSLVLCWRDGRPIATWNLSHFDGQEGEQFVAEVASMIEVGRQLHGALDRASTLVGTSRAQALADGLRLLGEDICLMNYAAELEQVAETDGDEASDLREWSLGLLRQREITVKTNAVRDVVGLMAHTGANGVPHEGSVTPIRIRNLFRPLRIRFADDPVILQFMALHQAQVDLGFVGAGEQCDTILDDLAEAKALSAESMYAASIDALVGLVKQRR